MPATGQPITALFAAGRPLVSVEFFPPKTDEGARQLLAAAEALAPFRPDFVSITYGAGGSTRERTLEFAGLLRDKFGFEVMPHLTCVGHSRAELAALLARLRDAGFRNLMALRGDPPKGETSFRPHPDGLRHAGELVAFIRENFPEFCMGVAGYPETHPEATSPADDLRHLKEKVNAGASFVTTQLFFNNAAYFDFVARARAASVGVPIVPGLLPALSHAQVKKFTGFCKAAYPAELEARLTALEGREAEAEAAGVDWAASQIRELRAGGAPGLHLYLLNRASVVRALFARIKASTP